MSSLDNFKEEIKKATVITRVTPPHSAMVTPRPLHPPPSPPFDLQMTRGWSSPRPSCWCSWGSSAASSWCWWCWPPLHVPDAGAEARVGMRGAQTTNIAWKVNMEVKALMEQCMAVLTHALTHSHSHTPRAPTHVRTPTLTPSLLAHNYTQARARSHASNRTHAHTHTHADTHARTHTNTGQGQHTHPKYFFA